MMGTWCHIDSFFCLVSHTGSSLVLWSWASSDPLRYSTFTSQRAPSHLFLQCPSNRGVINMEHFSSHQAKGLFWHVFKLPHKNPWCQAEFYSWPFPATTQDKTIRRHLLYLTKRELVREMYKNPPGTFFNIGVIIFKCLLLYRLYPQTPEEILYFSVWSEVLFL